MAHVSPEDKKKLTPAIKAVLKKYGIKGSISVRNHSNLVVKLTQGKLDIMGAYKQSALDGDNYDRYCPTEVQRLNWRLEATYVDVNTYFLDEAYAANETVVKFLQELKAAMKGVDFYDDSDSQSDYFNCSHYIDIKVGQWNKPYVFVGTAQTFEPVEVTVYKAPEPKVNADIELHDVGPRGTAAGVAAATATIHTIFENSKTTH
jgi:hypothetical protein